MAKKKLESTLELQRIAALRYNPYFEEQVSTIQKNYAIPRDKRKALGWFDNHSLEHGKSVPTLVHYIAIGTVSNGMGGVKNIKKTIIKPIERARTADELDGIVNSKVPLENDIIALMTRFKLPLMFFDCVLAYVVTREKVWLEYPDFAPNLVVSEHFGGENLLTATVTFTAWTTKKQWNELWQFIERVLAGMRSSKALDKPAKKIPSVHAIESQRQFIEQGLASMISSKALDKPAM